LEVAELKNFTAVFFTFSIKPQSNVYLKKRLRGSKEKGKRKGKEGAYFVDAVVVGKPIPDFLIRNACPLKLFRYLKRFSHELAEYGKNNVIFV